MYTGTLIRDLTATVEQVERRAEQLRMAESRELHEIFCGQIPAARDEQLLMGAA